MKLFTTAPPSVRSSAGDYLSRIADIARWHEDAGVEGMLIYTDNSLMDPWTVAQATIERTSKFVPLVATQPLYMHPLAAARKISSLGFLYGRKLALNMVAGGFVRDLKQLGDQAEHDPRYDRLTEYSQIMMALLHGETVTLAGEYYQVEGLRLEPALDEVLMPELFVSGMSPACQATAATLGATRLSYTKPREQLDQAAVAGKNLGVRFGVIARPRSEDAWEEARARFPADRRGQLAHRMAQGTSDSIWHQQISAVAEELEDARSGAYWLFPIKNYKTFCPYLVGSYEEVADYIQSYISLGFETLILDVPQGRDDLGHTMRAFDLCQQPVV
ncbi:LLM class flavin-dependent oxidoreductase [Phaeobacter inhibens]|uniref:LLM class flavin-dependent oxidoreductase n=1 Tax=Phaeobacter inhibens TaxID=221822 RepID=UPI000160CDA3|nr:LLM class flavin-dependent oxidoreductase [Phaeobacter inhibens]AFO87375.1 putative alkanesulfonate monooxygenase [Phaeobacter inhibens 2.10]AXT42179.1 LLM class flavin-dependent oxidoreductase [Phaeobacter inhibens]